MKSLGHLKCQGFSLLELMIVTGIFSITLVGALNLNSVQLKSQSNIESKREFESLISKIRTAVSYRKANSAAEICALSDINTLKLDGNTNTDPTLISPTVEPVEINKKLVFPGTQGGASINIVQQGDSITNLMKVDQLEFSLKPTGHPNSYYVNIDLTALKADISHLGKKELSAIVPLGIIAIADPDTGLIQKCIEPEQLLEDQLEGWAEDHAVDSGVLDFGVYPGNSAWNSSVVFSKKFKSTPKVITFLPAFHYANNDTATLIDFNFGTEAENITKTGFSLTWNGPSNCGVDAGCRKTYGKIGWIAVGPPENETEIDNNYIQYGETTIQSGASGSVLFPVQFENTPQVIFNLGKLDILTNCTGTHSLRADINLSSASQTGFTFSTTSTGTGSSCSNMVLTKVQWVAIGQNSAKKGQKVRVGEFSTQYRGPLSASIFFQSPAPKTTNGLVFMGKWCTNRNDDPISVSTVSAGPPGLSFVMTGNADGDCITYSRPRVLRWIASVEP